MFGRRREIKALSGRLGLLAAPIFALSLLAPQAASAETKSFVVSWFYPAMNSKEGDCPDGLNPLTSEVIHRIMREAGKTEEEIAALADELANFQSPTMTQYVAMRGRIDGKPVNAYLNPTSVPDSNLNFVKGKYAYGFNLDGKGAKSADAFEDPITGEKGVDNQLFRVLGCTETHRDTTPGVAAFHAYTWDVLRDNMPAWVITVSGDDLSKDGKVSVAFNRALDHVTRDASGDVMAGTTYRLESDDRNRNVFRGKIQKGVLTIEPGNFQMQADPYLWPDFVFKKMHLRLEMKPDGSAKGFLGGYQPWRPVYWMHAAPGIVNENMVVGDVPGLFYALRKGADAYPDPVTGENTSISATWWVDAVPAFVVQTDGKTPYSLSAAAR